MGFVNVTWDSDMKFVASVDGHKVALDASEESGGSNSGPRPKSLMMVALAGCTGMDVVSILKKMRVEITYFNLRVEGVVRDDHPRKYESMKIIYEFLGIDLDMDKLKKAVDLSFEKYCGVNANYKDSMKVEYEIVIL
jgi:putative redox protein